MAYDPDDPTTWVAKPVTTAAGTAGSGGTIVTPPPSAGTMVGTALRNALQFGSGLAGNIVNELSWGLEDPINRATAALFGTSQDYNRMMQGPGTAKAFAQQHPLIAAGTQAISSVPAYALGEGALARVVPVATGGGLLGNVANTAGAAIRNAAVSAGQAATEAAARGDDVGSAAARGAAIGAGAGAGANVVGSVVSPIVRGITGVVGDVSSQAADLVQKARDYFKIPMDATDLTNDPAFQRARTTFGGASTSGASANVADKTAAWQHAAVGQMGEDAPRFDSNTMQNANTRIGTAMNQMTASNSINFRQANGLVNDLSQIDGDINGAVIKPAQARELRRGIDAVMNKIQNGTISGSDYQDLTKTGSILDQLTNVKNPNAQALAQRIQTSLDNAWTASLSSADQAQWTKLRYQWRVMKTVEPLAAKSATGDIDPGEFNNAVVNASKKYDPSSLNMAYTGGGDLGDLSRIGTMIKPAPAAAPFPTNPLEWPARIAQDIAARPVTAWQTSDALTRALIQNAGRGAPPYSPAIIPGLVSGWNALQPP